MKLENFKILFFSEKKSKFRNFQFSLIFPKKIVDFFYLEKYFSTFFEKKNHLEKTYFQNICLLCRSEIFPGIKKSYLENRTGKLNIRKTKKSVFFILNIIYRPSGSDILCVVAFRLATRLQ